MSMSKFTKARVGMHIASPFFAPLSLRLTPQEDKHCPTMWTDGKSIGFNPEWVEKLPLDEVKGVIIHEVFHVAFHHTTRRGNREPFIWNLAADYVVNLQVVAAGYKLPPGALYDKKYAGWTAEKVYNVLIKTVKTITLDMGIGEVRDTKNGDGQTLTESERNEEDAKWNVAVQQAYSMAKKQGKVPGGLERLMEGLLEPRVDWRAALQEFVTKMSRNDYTWKKFNRRYLSSGWMLPSLEAPEIGTVVVGIDTSGSMGNDELQEIASEFNSIRTVHKMKIIVLFCDASVQRVQEFEDHDVALLKPKGGGGTAYSPVFTKVEELGEEPVCMVYFTDGECDDFPKYEPDYPVLWGLTYKNSYFKPPFGTTIHMKENQRGRY